MIQTTNSLCTAIKVFVQKGDNNKAKSEKFYIEAGIRLHRLKARLATEKPKGRMPWYKYVKQRCGLSQERADELIRISKGHITVEELRREKAESVSKSRVKSKRSERHPVLRSTGLTSPFQDPAKIGTCDFDPLDDRELKGEPYRVTRRRGYLWATREVVEFAERNLFARENKAEWAKITPDEIDDEIMEATQRAVDAWLHMLEKLRRLKRGTYGSDQKEETTSASLH